MRCYAPSSQNLKFFSIAAIPGVGKPGSASSRRGSLARLTKVMCAYAPGIVFPLFRCQLILANWLARLAVECLKNPIHRCEKQLYAIPGEKSQCEGRKRLK